MTVNKKEVKSVRRKKHSNYTLINLDNASNQNHIYNQ